MASTHLNYPLLSIVVGVLVSLITWGWIQYRNREGNDDFLRAHDDLLLGLLVLAVFVLGTSVTFFLLSLV